MILVLLGTQNNSFHRLLEEIDRLIEKEVIKDKVIVQSGYTNYNSDRMEIIDFIPKEEIAKYRNDADVIITHGGVGSIVSSVKENKKVIAVPRLHQYAEHVNNHQKEIVELFNQKGYIIGLNDVSELEEAIKRIKGFKPIKYEQNNDRMLQIISDFIDKV